MFTAKNVGTHISLMQQTKVAQLKEISKSCRVAELCPDLLGALIRVVQLGDQLLQVVPSDLHLKVEIRI